MSEFTKLKEMTQLELLEEISPDDSISLADYQVFPPKKPSKIKKKQDLLIEIDDEMSDSSSATTLKPGDLKVLPKKIFD